MDELIESGEDVGEIIARVMTWDRKNRINWDETENIIFGNSLKYFKGENESKNENYTRHGQTMNGLAFTIVNELLRMKLEKRTDESLSHKSLVKHQKELLSVGFKHETYKNHFILRGLKSELNSYNGRFLYEGSLVHRVWFEGDSHFGGGPEGNLILK